MDIEKICMIVRGFSHYLMIIFLLLFACQHGAMEYNTTQNSIQEKNLALSNSLEEDCIWIQHGEIPLLITAPHGGMLSFQDIPMRQHGTVVKDLKTLELTKELNANLSILLSKKPYIVASHISRKYIDFNRKKELAFEHSSLEELYDQYHTNLSNFVKDIKNKYGYGLLIDIHGQSADPHVIFLGTQNGKTIMQLIAKFGLAARTGSMSLTACLEKYGYTCFPSLQNSMIKEDSRFNEGYTVQTYGSHHEDGINAVQLEIGSMLRYDDKRQKFCQDLAQAIALFYTTYFNH